MTEVEYRGKEPAVICPCSCGKWGQLARNGHVIRCDASVCFKCRGRRNRASGDKAATKARRALGIPETKFNSRHEETWADALFATEVKSGAQVAPAVTAWLRIKAQIDQNRPTHGEQHKAARAVLMPAGMSDGLVIVELSTWRLVVLPALVAFYSPEGAA